VTGVRRGQAYAFRAAGPYDPVQGHRFNPHKVLLDPYATALAGTERWDFSRAFGFDPRAPLRDLSCSEDDDAPWVAKSLVADRSFDWQEDRRPSRPWSDTVIYETHVRGLTIHPSSRVTQPGTFLGVVEKIPYLSDLGITAVELMPVQEFNEREVTHVNPLTGERLRNYWGYSTVAFFAPKETYSSRSFPGCQVAEFKTMVRELHRAGIEVVLDVVFNHTAERSELGPTLNFRGLDNSIYYLLDTNKRFYKDYSGCGNTVNCSHPVVRSYILDCLRYWVAEMHVDGFRFDLASVLDRDERGNLVPTPLLLESIAEDPILHSVKLIAEAWDAGGAFQIGFFPGQRWSEWNARFRDDVRRFWRGDGGIVGAFATRLCGSADLYQRGGKEPVSSVNFVTCHDGFTLNDAVSYERKHNEANGENNWDGMNENYSANYGAEGETADPRIDALRVRQIKNMLATLFVSRGVPMLLGGDEFRRTQGGNNNAYCQDNETSWYDWTLLDRHAEVHRFTREMAALRRRHPVLRAEAFYSDREVQWFGPGGRAPEWSASPNTLGCRIVAGNEAEQGGYALCLLFNAGPREQCFTLPEAPGGQGWRRAVDTALPSPNDIREVDREKPLEDQRGYLLQGCSMAILVSG
jgi:glycogen operon protein